MRVDIDRELLENISKIQGLSSLLSAEVFHEQIWASVDREDGIGGRKAIIRSRIEVQADKFATGCDGKSVSERRGEKTSIHVRDPGDRRQLKCSWRSGRVGGGGSKLGADVRVPLAAIGVGGLGRTSTAE